MLSRVLHPHRRTFTSLNEREILSLAVAAEEEDGRIYATYAEKLRPHYPATAAIFDGMAAEEDTHRRRLLDRYVEKFGSQLVPIRREHVTGFLARRPLWLGEIVDLDMVRQQSFEMERQAYLFYLEAAKQTTDATTRKLLGDLAMEEKAHEHAAGELEEAHLAEGSADAEATEAIRQVLLTYVQPGLAGLMDGSVSTLAPVFAAAFATGDTSQTFLVGLAAAVGAGISMGFAEALSDDGSLTGRGAPLLRGTVCGAMTAIGGLGHTLPYLIPHFWTATAVSIFVVALELAAISWIRTRYMDTPFLQAAFQVVVGGVLVFIAGILIGSS
jgi:rubrerythrin